MSQEERVQRGAVRTACLVVPACPTPSVVRNVGAPRLSSGSFARGALAHRHPHLVPLLVTVVEAARLLGVGRSSAYELLAAGELES